MKPTTKPCPGRGCTNEIPKPARGPWSELCEECKRARAAALKRQGRAAKKERSLYPICTPGCPEVGWCERHGRYNLKGGHTSGVAGWPRDKPPRHLDVVGETASLPSDGEYIPEPDFWPGMGRSSRRTPEVDLGMDANAWKEREIGRKRTNPSPRPEITAERQSNEPPLSTHCSCGSIIIPAGAATCRRCEGPPQHRREPNEGSEQRVKALTGGLRRSA